MKQLYKESLKTYKKNIKNIIWMAWPIFVITSIINYVNGNKTIALPALASILAFIALLSVSLFFQPALYRSVQKNEDDDEFDSRDAYKFQKKHIWKYIVLYFWAIVYSIKINIKYILYVFAMLFLWFLANLFTPSFNSIIGIILGLIILAILVFMIIKNLPKFVLFQNVFFSKSIKPRKAVLESIELGGQHSWNVWKIVLLATIINIIISIAYLILFGILILLKLMSFNDLMIVKDIGVTPTILVVQVLSYAISSFFVIPFMFIIFAKGYNKLK